MSDRPIYDKVSEKMNYNNMSSFHPLKPLAIWANTNSELDKFYKINNITDKNVKNSMRHIVGLAIAGQEYPRPVASFLGGVKEKGDQLDNFYFKEPKYKFSDEYLLDIPIDKKNNNLGLDYAKKNKNATLEQIMNYAYKKTLEDYPTDYANLLFKTITKENNPIPNESLYNNSNDVYFEPKRTLYNQLTK